MGFSFNKFSSFGVTEVSNKFPNENNQINCNNINNNVQNDYNIFNKCKKQKKEYLSLKNQKFLEYLGFKIKKLYI